MQCAPLRHSHGPFEQYLLGIYEDPDTVKVSVGAGLGRMPRCLHIDLYAQGCLPADVRALDFLPDGYADLVVAHQILEHLPYPDAKPALTEWARILRPGGRIVLSVPDLDGIIR